MAGGFTPARTPLASRDPVVGFAVIRALLSVAAVIALAIFGFPYEGNVTAVVAAVALPWAVFVLAVTRHSTDAGLNPLIVLGDMTMLGILIAVEPELVRARAVHRALLRGRGAHCQGASLSAFVGVLPPLVLIPVTFAADVPVETELLHVYEVIFAVACLSTAVVVGAMREAESSARIRARALSRRTIDTESSVRRRIRPGDPRRADPGADQRRGMMVASAEHALGRGDEAEARRALSEARSLTRANIGFLRDEVLDLGPLALEELSFEQAVLDCIRLWERRFPITVKTRVSTPTSWRPRSAGPLLRITQEAVANAGKHGEPSTITVRLHCEERERDSRGRGRRARLRRCRPARIRGARAHRSRQHA